MMVFLKHVLLEEFEFFFCMIFFSRRRGGGGRDDRPRMVHYTKEKETGKRKNPRLFFWGGGII